MYMSFHIYFYKPMGNIEQKYEVVKTIGYHLREGVYVFIYTDIEKASYIRKN